MEPLAPHAFQPAQAGALLIVLTAITIAVGALIGWAAGSVRAGLVVGVLLGVPVGIVGVYRRYRGYFS
jgi:F0F1-type ATP synthase assembly protein I